MAGSQLKTHDVDRILSLLLHFSFLVYCVLLLLVAACLDSESQQTATGQANSVCDMICDIMAGFVTVKYVIGAFHLRAFWFSVGPEILFPW